MQTIIFIVGDNNIITCYFSRRIIYHAKKGNDNNNGASSQPLKTIAEAAKRINASTAKEATTIILSEGVYALTETALFNNNKFTAESRLTIRAAVLPDEANWNPQRMPIITTIIPGTPTQGDGEESRGLEIEASHVTIEGLRFTGSPAYYYMEGYQDRRYYPIWRTKFILSLMTSGSRNKL